MDDTFRPIHLGNRFMYRAADQSIDDRIYYISSLEAIHRHELRFNKTLQNLDSHRRFAESLRIQQNPAEVRLLNSLQQHCDRVNWEWEWQSQRFPFFGWFPDFYEPSSRLIIEIDGSSHSETRSKDLNRDCDFNAISVYTHRIKRDDIYTSLFRVVKDIEVLYRWRTLSMENHQISDLLMLPLRKYVPLPDELLKQPSSIPLRAEGRHLARRKIIDESERNNREWWRN